jgi:hypothetical protein
MQVQSHSMPRGMNKSLFTPFSYRPVSSFFEYITYEIMQGFARYSFFYPS